MHVYIFRDNIFCHYIRWGQIVKAFNCDQGDEGSNFTKWI